MEISHTFKCRKSTEFHHSTFHLCDLECVNNISTFYLRFTCSMVLSALGSIMQCKVQDKCMLFNGLIQFHLNLVSFQFA